MSTHLLISSLAVSLTIVAAGYDLLGVSTGKRLWPILARIHIAIAGVLLYLSLLSGAAVPTTDANKAVADLLQTHRLLGTLVVVIMIIMANYRVVLRPLLRPVFFKVYLASTALLVGLLIGVFLNGHMAGSRYRLATGQPTSEPRHESWPLSSTSAVDSGATKDQVTADDPITGSSEGHSETFR